MISRIRGGLCKPMSAHGGGLSVAASVSTARGGDLGPFWCSKL